jgi:prepilin-type N-terminal cleavage/methylation domain-containing protein
MPEPGTQKQRCWIRRRRNGASGFGLIELMIAMAILTVGLLGSMIMIVTGMASNSRNKRDNAATILDQELLETFATLNNYPKTGSVNIYDCALSTSNGNLHLANLAQGAYPTGAGATLITTGSGGTSAGDIDWTQATPTLATSTVTGYAMNYQTCGGDIYEVRWNIMDANTTAPTGTASRVSVLTVSSRLSSSVNGTNAVLFALPTTLRTIIESNQY